MAKYSDKLKSPKWQMKRLTIFSRDHFRCCICNNKEKELHVHHLYYLPNIEPWEYDDDCYVTLCDDCHKIYHAEFSKIIGLLAFQVIKKQKTFFDIKHLIDLL